MCRKLATLRELTPRGSCRLRPRDRKGTVLIVFALIVFGVLAIGALLVDMGYARLTQRQMETGTASAALEGLRFRDDIPVDQNPDLVQLIAGAGCGQPPATTQSLIDPQWIAWRDCGRRVLAQGLATNIFDDDFNSATGDALQLGAGPELTFSGGVGDPSLHASEFMSVPSMPVYKPALQFNSADPQAGSGDMVAGNYGLNSSFTGSASTVEDSAYNRQDFEPSSGATGTADRGNGFLVRMRRSNETFGTGNGTASNGPPLPYVFGRGSLMSRDTIGQGITVRAATIAAAGTAPVSSGTISLGRAKSAGPPHAEVQPAIPGLAPFALTSSFWSDPSWQNSASQQVSVAATGSISSPTLPTLGPVGVVGPSNQSLLTIGEQFTAGTDNTALTQAANPTAYLYVPIYQSLTSGQQTIVGFGYVQWTYSPGTSQLSLTRAWDGSQPVGQRLVDVIGRGNVSPSLAAELPAGWTTDEATELFAAHESITQSLLAPVLANRQSPLSGATLP